MFRSTWTYIGALALAAAGLTCASQPVIPVVEKAPEPISRFAQEAQLSEQCRASPGSEACEALAELHATWIDRVEVGDYHSCALTRAAQVWCWGRNDHGQSGQDELRDAPLPRRVVIGGEDRPVVDLSVGSDHACVVDHVGQVWCWGRGSEFGTLGLAAAMSPRPVPIVTDPELRFHGSSHHWQGKPLGDVARVLAGACYSCALGNDSKMRCWGGHDGYWDNDAKVREMKTIPGAVTAAAGRQSPCVLAANGSVYCGLHDAVSAYEAAPAGAKAVSAGMSPCVLDTQGAVSCWTEGSRSPDPVGLSSVAWIDGWCQQLCTARKDGRVECGTVADGVLGSVRPIAGITQATSVDAPCMARQAHGCAATREGRAKCWGRNDRGQLGDGTTIARPVAVMVRLGVGDAPRPGDALSDIGGDPGAETTD